MKNATLIALCVVMALTLFGCGTRNQNAGGVPAAASVTEDEVDTIFNGEVTEIRDIDGTPQIELKSLEDDSKIIFNISDETQIYMDEDDIIPGARLTVYHSGKLTRSNPPIGQALEIRPYQGG